MVSERMRTRTRKGNSARRVVVGVISSMSLLAGLWAVPASAETTDVTVYCPVGVDVLGVRVNVPLGVSLVPQGENPVAGVCAVSTYTF